MLLENYKQGKDEDETKRSEHCKLQFIGFLYAEVK
jgi:hypothetical protein